MLRFTFYVFHSDICLRLRGRRVARAARTSCAVCERPSYATSLRPVVLVSVPGSAAGESHARPEPLVPSANGQATPLACGSRFFHRLRRSVVPVSNAAYKPKGVKLTLHASEGRPGCGDHQSSTGTSPGAWRRRPATGELVSSQLGIDRHAGIIRPCSPDCFRCRCSFVNVGLDNKYTLIARPRSLFPLT